MIKNLDARHLLARPHRLPRCQWLKATKALDLGHFWEGRFQPVKWKYIDVGGMGQAMETQKKLNFPKVPLLFLLADANRHNCFEWNFHRTRMRCSTRLYSITSIPYKLSKMPACPQKSKICKGPCHQKDGSLPMSLSLPCAWISPLNETVSLKGLLCQHLPPFFIAAKPRSHWKLPRRNASGHGGEGHSGLSDAKFKCWYFLDSWNLCSDMSDMITRQLSLCLAW